MEQFNSGELKKIFKANFHNLVIGLTLDGNHAWQKEKERNLNSIPTIQQNHMQNYVKNNGYGI